jgi:phospholipase C
MCRKATVVLSLFLAVSLALLAGSQGSAGRPGAGAPQGIDRIEHIVVIVIENRSFDHLYGLFPGADGIAQATEAQKTQLDHDGTPLPTLPPVYRNGAPSSAFPLGLPNGPFRIDASPVNRGMAELLPSPVHSFFRNREQINGGRNNLFVAMSDAGAWTMGHFEGSRMKLWQWAREYTLADHFFMAAYGGSYLNHQWLISASTPRQPDAPDALRAQIGRKDRLQKLPSSPGSVMAGPVQVADGRISPDGYTVNTSQPPYQPSGIPPQEGGDARLADPAGVPVPPQEGKTIGDTLSARGVSWAWYAGGWRAALQDGCRPPTEKRGVIYSREAGNIIFQPHHQPFNFYARFAPGTPDRERHLKDYEDFLAAIDGGTLPQVSFYKPAGSQNQHPSYSTVAAGDEHIHTVLERLRGSVSWPRMAVIVAYDENGGFWDHVPPPSGSGWSDRWGPGTRVPALIISPFARRGYVDKTPYDTTSIIKFITKRFRLEPLPGVRRKAGDLTNAFMF